MNPRCYLRASIFLIAALGLAGCGDYPTGGVSACPLGSHDGGDGTCVPVGRCALGYVENDAGECRPESEDTGSPRIGVPAYVTAGESYTASVENPIATSTYAWTVDGGALQTASGVSVTFTAGSSGMVTLSCVETDRAGAKGKAATATSTIVARPVRPVIDLPDRITAWQSHTASVIDPVATSTYFWTIDGGMLDPTTGASATFTAGSPGTVTLSCVETNRAGTPGQTGTVTRVIVEDPGGPGVAAIAAGRSHTCALKTDGGVWCWGYNYFGQIGTGTDGGGSGDLEYRIPMQVTNLSDAAAIAAGFNHTCALTTGGGVRCWGTNDYGQLGDGTSVDSATPVEVTNLPMGVTAIAASYGHSCALTTDLGVWCWGANYSGQLGDGTSVDSATPVKVANLSSGTIAIAAGFDHTCALTTDGAVHCWGSNGYGQLGVGTNGGAPSTPVEVMGLSRGVAAIAAGSYHSHALTDAGGLRSWGDNWYGQLGIGATGVSRSSPVEVPSLSSGVASIAAGHNHACALTAGSGVRCWGSGSDGQLGDGGRGSDGAFHDSGTPVEVRNLSRGVLAVTAGESHTCALEFDGGVWCWGSNDHGQLGNGTNHSVGIPVEVTGLSR